MQWKALGHKIELKNSGMREKIVFIFYIAALIVSSHALAGPELQKAIESYTIERPRIVGDRAAIEMRLDEIAKLVASEKDVDDVERRAAYRLLVADYTSVDDGKSAITYNEKLVETEKGEEKAVALLNLASLISLQSYVDQKAFPKAKVLDVFAETLSAIEGLKLTDPDPGFSVRYADFLYMYAHRLTLDRSCDKSFEIFAKLLNLPPSQLLTLSGETLQAAVVLFVRAASLDPDLSEGDVAMTVATLKKISNSTKIDVPKAIRRALENGSKSEKSEKLLEIFREQKPPAES